METVIPETVQIIAFAFLMAALALSFLRLLRGPTVNDRIVAMDLTASIITGFILLYSVMIKKAIYFDMAIVISLISFIGTVAISTYLKQKK